jgi:hypothetical protein
LEEKRLGEILVEGGKASAEDVRRALDLQAQVGGRVGRLLVAMGIVAEEVLVEALSRQFRIPKVSLRGRTAGPGLIALVPEELARRRILLPVALSRSGENEVLYVATSDPTDRAGVEELAQVSGREVIPVLAPYDELLAAIDRSYRGAEAALSGEGSGALALGEPASRGLVQESSLAARVEALIWLLLRKGVIRPEELEEALRRK